MSIIFWFLILYHTRDMFVCVCVHLFIYSFIHSFIHSVMVYVTTLTITHNRGTGSKVQARWCTCIILNLVFDNLFNLTLKNLQKTKFHAFPMVLSLELRILIK